MKKVKRLICRLFGHNWKPIIIMGPFGFLGSSTGIWSGRNRCVRCGEEWVVDKDLRSIAYHYHLEEKKLNDLPNYTIIPGEQSS